MYIQTYIIYIWKKKNFSRYHYPHFTYEEIRVHKCQDLPKAKLPLGTDLQIFLSFFWCAYLRSPRLFPFTQWIFKRAWGLDVCHSFSQQAPSQLLLTSSGDPGSSPGIPFDSSQSSSHLTDSPSSEICLDSTPPFHPSCHHSGSGLSTFRRDSSSTETRRWLPHLSSPVSSTVLPKSQLWSPQITALILSLPTSQTYRGSLCQLLTLDIWSNLFCQFSFQDSPPFQSKWLLHCFTIPWTGFQSDCWFSLEFLFSLPGSSSFMKLSFILTSLLTLIISSHSYPFLYKILEKQNPTFLVICWNAFTHDYNWLTPQSIF